MILFCTVCHTRWDEACLDVRDPCPFVDCDGRLTMTSPRPPKPPQKKRKKLTAAERLPLLRELL